MKQNLRKKALVPAIAMVLASVIALSGVTYAWFTTGTTASVTGMDVNVKTANGIQVSLDASSWKSVITATDIKNAITGATAYANRMIQYPEGEISPVSSAGNVSNGKLAMFGGEYNNAGNLRGWELTDKNGTTECDYIAFDLFFKSTSEQPLTLKVGDDASFVKETLALGGVENTGVEKAVRVAFIPMGSVNGNDAAGARGLKMESGKAIIWEPNSGSRAAGVDAETGKLAYNGFTKAFEDVAESALADEVEAVTSVDGTQEDMIMLANGITKVRVYIWLEGQDVDCVNNISSGDFTVNLGFTVPEPEAN